TAQRAGLACHLAEVRCAETSSSRRWAQIAPALAGHDLAHKVFNALAQAEADVHGIGVADVHFHEVGALDAIADIVAVSTLVTALSPQRVVVSPVCVGLGLGGHRARQTHGPGSGCDPVAGRCAHVRRPDAP
ncbi:MAG: LarC family nickel insertion protein, partial [Candidatus Nanopelagicales bacterium]|nr:LarC family nickel insertion protein [Candidatus Nanopelagicales bacterium]